MPDIPRLKRVANQKELNRIFAFFLQAETDIVNEIGRLRSMGLVDYHAVAALERVQNILQRLETDCWEYVPQMIEKQFYVRAPEARKIVEPVRKHIVGYANAAALSSSQMDIVQKLTMNLMGKVVEASKTVMTGLQEALIGRIEPDIYRRVGLEQTGAMQATGRSVSKTVPAVVDALRREGVTAFVDRAGRHWSLHAYGSMVARTTSRQAEVLAVLTADPDQDLYKISSHGTTCKLCAPYEGRVYSRSGKNPDFPPLAAAFGKVDPNGGDDLSNTWLNIHPGCLHALISWTPAGRSEEEIQKIKDFSSFKKNPPSIDPRTEWQRKAYRAKEKARAKLLADRRQWEQYRMMLGEKTPKTFQTFLRHKVAGDEKYTAWREDYKKRFYLQEHLDYNWNGEDSFIPFGTHFETVKTIAGKGTKTVLRKEPLLINEVGGQSGQWRKKVGKIESDKYIFDIHWYELDGIQYNTKIKERREKSRWRRNTTRHRRR